MKRRDFIRTTAAGSVAAGAATFSAPAIAQDKKTLKMVTPWPKNFPGLGTSAQRLAKRITQASDGRLDVKVFAAGELVPALESFDAVSGGTADLYHAAEYYWQGKSNGFAFFTTVPYGFTPQEMHAWIHYGGGQELWDELSAQYNIKPILCGNTGAQMAGWFRQPIESLEDLKGLKFRTPGLGGEVMRQVGANVVTLPGGEIFTSLQSGAIDAAEWVGPWNDLAFGFHQITKHYYYPGYQEPNAALSCGINRKVWNDLSDADHAVIQAACLAEADYTLAEFDANNGDALDTLINEHGVQLHRFSDDILKSLGEASRDVVADTAQESALTKRIYESYTAFREKMIRWTDIANREYLNARALTLSDG
ncbi:TRAP transporter substrate-binding protein [Rhodovibrio salinarum]|uniref:ABC transporter substrate-binding protein n=1 Tax=Rhodovibrio salinarum TaxID=1087 RepID=A0A934QJ12_9PROT|nr:TRAP transporter substrate-binding protein [Rhodovibrio salinarum]MBK1697881.1 ABC transporter substrate-binding protein [Rhodovibrio salinarum]